MSAKDSNADQRSFWSDQAGPKWARHQAPMDALLQPVLDGMLDRAGLRPGDQVLDLGCGAGSSTLQAATHVRPDGQVTGADISDTLLALARERSAGVDAIHYLHVDAATHEFQPDHFDHLISRFGSMFFEDSVAAFANMAHGLKPGAQVTLATWGQIPNNPYFKEAAAAARAVLGPMPKSDPDAPGPFAFRDLDRVLAILTDAGFRDVQAEVVEMDLIPEGGLDGLVSLLGAIGAAEAAMRHFEATDDQRAAVADSLRETFAQFETGREVRVPAEINFFTARR